VYSCQRSRNRKVSIPAATAFGLEAGALEPFAGHARRWLRAQDAQCFHLRLCCVALGMVAVASRHDPLLGWQDGSVGQAVRAGAPAEISQCQAARARRF
jgi:hypothetical protein